MTDTKAIAAKSNPLRRRFRFSVRTLLLVTTVIALVFAAMAWGAHSAYRYFNPSWIETFSVQDNQLRVVDTSNRPIGEAIVIHMTGKTDMHGGWVGGLQIPPAGASQDVQVTFRRLKSWSIRSEFTAVNGLAQIPRFQVKCQGQRRPGPSSYSSHGYCIVVVYKRGYEPQIIQPLVNRAFASDVVLKRIRLEDYERHGYEVYSDSQAIHTHDQVQSDSVRTISIPFHQLEQFDGPAVRAYWDHKLPSGETVAAFALREMQALNAILKSEYVRKEHKSMMSSFRKKTVTAVNSEQPQDPATPDQPR